MPCPGPFHFSHSVDYIYEFCPLPDPDVGPSIFVCDVEHTSFHFGLCGRTFVLCLFGQCPGLCTICHSCSTQELYTCLFRQMARMERGSSVVECWTRNQVSPGSNLSLLPFRRLGIFVLSIDAPVDSAV